MTIHKLRKNKAAECPVCAAPAWTDCHMTKEAFEENLLEWLEFELFRVLHDIKLIAPDHFMVTTAEIALQSRPTTNPQQQTLDI